jgi:hypothetical protein
MDAQTSHATALIRISTGTAMIAIVDKDNLLQNKFSTAIAAN